MNRERTSADERVSLTLLLLLLLAVVGVAAEFVSMIVGADHLFGALALPVTFLLTLTFVRLGLEKRGAR